MTLVAAYQELGMPVLLGDFLLSASGIASGSRKKICRVSPNLAVGWCGHLVAAELVLNEMRHRFAGRRPSKADLESYLTTYQVSTLGSLEVHLVGWVIGSDASCFRWNSLWPRELFYGPHHYAGSGAQRFVALAGEGGSKGDVPKQHPARSALHSVAPMMMDEVSNRVNRAAGFGYGYEILYLDDSEFVYVDDITFAFAEVDFSQEGRYIRTNLAPVVYRYSSVGEIAILQTDTWRSDESRRHETHRDLITPPFELPEGEVTDLVSRISRFDYPLSPVGPRINLLISPIRDADTTDARPVAPLHLDQWPEDVVKTFEMAFEPAPGSNAMRGTLRLQMPGPDLLEKIFAAIVAQQPA